MKSITFFGGYSCGISTLFTKIIGDSNVFQTYPGTIKAFTNNNEIKIELIEKYADSFPIFSSNVKQTVLDYAVLFEMHGSQREELDKTQKCIMQNTNALFLVIDSDHFFMTTDNAFLLDFISYNRFTVNFVLTKLDFISQEIEYCIFMEKVKEMAEKIKDRGCAVEGLYCLYYNRIPAYYEKALFHEEWVDVEKMKKVIEQSVY